MKREKHRGFKAVQKEIAEKQGISKTRAGAILAASARKESPEALRKNPRLRKVSGVSKKPKSKSK